MSRQSTPSERRGPRDWGLRLLGTALALGTAIELAEGWFRAGQGGDWVVVDDLKFARPPGWTGPGWVDTRRPEARAPGDRRVLCVGDSVTEGVGVAAGEAWPAQLATALGLGERELYNFGVSGWDAEQVATLAETRLAAWEPDVVVWGTYANDQFPMRVIYDTGDGYPRWVAAEPPAACAGLPRGAARWLLQRSAAYRVVPAATFARCPAAQAAADGGPGWYATQAARVAAWSRRTGVRVVALALPPHVLATACRSTPQCRTLERWHTGITRGLEHAGIEWIDGLRPLEGGGPYFLAGSDDIDHPVAEAHRRWAAAVAEVIGEPR